MNCLSDGDLRAFCDGESDLSVGQHLAECHSCQSRAEVIRQQSIWVLHHVASLGVDRVVPVRRKAPWRTFAAFGAIAAMAAWFYWTPKPTPQLPPVPVAVVAKPAVPDAPLQLQQAAHPRKPARIRPESAFETAVLMRVALGPDEVLADVLVTPDGRIQALRLVDQEGQE